MAKKEFKFKRGHGVIPGVVLTLLGLIFLLDNYKIVNIDLGRLWPLFLLVPGVCMLYRAYKNK